MVKIKSLRPLYFVPFLFRAPIITPLTHAGFEDHRSVQTRRITGLLQ